MAVILVADDDDAIREAVVALLRDSGYQVSCAADGVQALEAMGDDWDPPDLLVLDLMMPRMNGWEVLRAMAASERLARVPVIVLTAFDARAGLPGGHLVLHKPFEQDLLLGAVGRMLE